MGTIRTPATKTMLVVDDDPAIRSLLVDVFGSEEYVVDTAANGYIALDLIARRQYDIIIIDLHMPVLDGIGLYRELGRSQPDLLTRVIFITGSIDDTRRAGLVGIDVPIVKKPFPMDVLRDTIKAVLPSDDH